MKKTILSCLMLLAGLTASAQEQKGTTESSLWVFSIPSVRLAWVT